MAQVIRRALHDREHPLPRNLVVMVDGNVLRLTRESSAQIVERTRRRAGSHNAKRPSVVRAVVDHLRDQYRRALGVAAPDDPDWDRELDDRLRRLPDVRAALERMWPVLSGGDLIHDLFSFPALVRSAADGILSRADQALLVRDRSTSLRDVPWSEADMPLIDEADALLGPPDAARPRRRRARRGGDDAGARVVSELGVGGFITASELARRYRGDVPSDEPVEEPRTFGHVVVDEAQDLSAMQWRMLARRCPSGSMTVVGDFGQASLPGALHDWDQVLAQLPQRATPRRGDPDRELPDPGRDHGRRAAGPRALPRPASSPPGRFATPATGPASCASPRSSSATRSPTKPDGPWPPAAPWRCSPRPRTTNPSPPGSPTSAPGPGAATRSTPRSRCLSAAQAKGLEFDHVVLVEPRRLVTDDPPGLRLLYVAMTRATRGLAIVHADPLPDALAAAALTGAPLAAS